MFVEFTIISLILIFFLNEEKSLSELSYYIEQCPKIIGSGRCHNCFMQYKAIKVKIIKKIKPNILCY